MPEGNCSCLPSPSLCFPLLVESLEDTRLLLCSCVLCCMADMLGLFIFFLQCKSLWVPKSCWKSAYPYVLMKLLPQWLFLELQRRIWSNYRARQGNLGSTRDGHPRYTWGWASVRDLAAFFSEYPSAWNSTGTVGPPLLHDWLCCTVLLGALWKSESLAPGWEKLSVSFDPPDPRAAA